MFEFFRHYTSYLHQKNNSPVKHHFACVAKKDRSGRIRYFVYIDGVLAKNELTIEGWYDERTV